MATFGEPLLARLDKSKSRVLCGQPDCGGVLASRVRLGGLPVDGVVQPARVRFSAAWKPRADGVWVLSGYGALARRRAMLGEPPGFRAVYPRPEKFTWPEEQSWGERRRQLQQLMGPSPIPGVANDMARQRAWVTLPCLAECPTCHQRQRLEAEALEAD